MLGQSDGGGSGRSEQGSQHVHTLVPSSWYDIVERHSGVRYRVSWSSENFQVVAVNGSSGLLPLGCPVAVDVEGRIAACIVGASLRIAWLNRVSAGSLVPWAGYALESSRASSSEVLAVGILGAGARFVVRSEDRIHILYAEKSNESKLRVEAEVEMGSDDIVGATFIRAVPFVLGRQRSWKYDSRTSKFVVGEHFETYLNECCCFDRAITKLGMVMASSGYLGGQLQLNIWSDNKDFCVINKSLKDGRMPRRIVVDRNGNGVSLVHESKVERVELKAKSS